jgi:hypothetical protein
MIILNRYYMNDNFKPVKAVLPPPPFHMVGDGFRVHNFFPSLQVFGENGMDPFFLLDYNSKWNIAPSEKQRGVGVHPHRGFETVTISYHGRVAHHDSAGNSGVIGEGDVQWMTAGSGVLHKEFHEKEWSRKGGIFQVVQIWVNLPAKFKMTAPKYQPIVNSNMGKFLLDGNKGVIEVIAGEYKGVRGPASTFTPVNMFNARLMDGANVEFSFPESFNTGFLVVEGEVKINEDKIVPENNFVFFEQTGHRILIVALKNSVVLILNGKPINEPVASGGPFVMNTESELKEAYRDYHSGKFGYLED